jgi:hypothetical protein
VGSGDVLLSGKANSQTVTLSGNSNYDARSLMSETGELKSVGNANISVSISKSVSVLICGNGIINLYGNPKIISSNITGSGLFNLLK